MKRKKKYKRGLAAVCLTVLLALCAGCGREKERPSDAVSQPSASPSVSALEEGQSSLNQTGDQPEKPQPPLEQQASNPEPQPKLEPNKQQRIKPTAPESNPQPEPPKAQPDDSQITCTMTIRCDSILEHMEDLVPEKQPLIPADGILYTGKDLTIEAGSTVFDLLAREVRDAKLHMEFSRSALYDSVYVEGIGNLYEFDCGPLSGWMYKVNGGFPDHGCSQQKLADGDLVEWVYVCEYNGEVGQGQQ